VTYGGDQVLIVDEAPSMREALVEVH